MENMKLKLARIEKQLSQQELAELVEVTRQTIGLIEKGKYNPSLQLAWNISQVFKSTIEEVFNLH